MTPSIPSLSLIMATPHPHTGPVGPDTLITVKVLIDNQNRRFKLALRDLGAHVLPQQVCSLSDRSAWTTIRHQPDWRL